MLRFLNHDTSYDFMSSRKLAMGLSALLIVASFVSLFTRGINFGIDFTGGVLLEVAYDQNVELESIRATLAEEGFPDALVQTYGSAREILIRLPPAEDAEAGGELGGMIASALREQNPSAQVRRNEFVESQVGDELTEQGGLAMLFALIFIFGYVMARFQWKFAAGAIAALVHDVILTVGFFSVTGLEFDLATLAAILAVIGYSLNDTIVVYDRIRENFRAMRRGTNVEVVNASINQTLARTVITGVTTLLVLFALAFLGGEAVYAFSVALIAGIVIGTYSSIYVASAAALEFDVSPTDLMPPEREEVDDMP